jgi:hypothetical protein
VNLRYVIRTYVNVTMYPPYNHDLPIKTNKQINKTSVKKNRSKTRHSGTTWTIVEEDPRARHLLDIVVTPRG